MAARRCSLCDINFPDDRDRCEACEEPTWELLKDDYDDDWSEKVALRMRARRFDSGYQPDLDVSVLDHRGQKWVPEELLLDEGVSPEPFMVVSLMGDFYELSALKDGPVPAWWLTLIDWTAEAEDLYNEIPVLSQAAYARLEAKRGIREL